MSGLENDEDLYDYDGMTDEKNEEIIELLKKYSEIKQKVNHDNIEIDRYIKILTLDEYKQRSTKIKKRYKVWLDKQLSLLNEPSSKYKIYKSTWAPRWGSSQSYILTNNSYLHIIGQGIAAVHIKGNQIVKQIKSKMSDAIESAQNDDNKPKPFLKSHLEKYIANLNERSDLDVQQKILSDIASQESNIIEKENSIEHIEARQQDILKQEQNIKTNLDKKYVELEKEKERLAKLLERKKILDYVGYESAPGDHFKLKSDSDILRIIKKLGPSGISKVHHFKAMLKRMKRLGINSKEQLLHLKSDNKEANSLKALLYDLLKLYKIKHQDKIKIIDILISEL